MLSKYEILDDDINETAESVLEITTKGINIFKSSQPGRKNQLLKLLVLKCTLGGAKSSITLKKLR